MRHWNTSKHRLLLACALACTFVSGCNALPGPREITADGLERVPSRASGGVFRAPGAPFTQYKRVIVEPLTIAFVKGWEARHEDFPAEDLARLRTDAARDFREAFARVLIHQGAYSFADDPAPDVLMISPAVVDLDIPAPEIRPSDKHVLTTRSVAMRIAGDLRDAATGKLVGRVDAFTGGEEYGIGPGQLRSANRVTNTHEMRLGFTKWAHLLREALDVAKVERPRPPAEPPPPQ